MTMLPVSLSLARLDWTGRGAQWDWTDWVGSIALLLCVIFLLVAARALFKGLSPFDIVKSRRAGSRGNEKTGP